MNGQSCPREAATRNSPRLISSWTSRVCFCCPGTLTVTVDADGSIVTARASSDPGHGFARAAERAMRSGACTGTPAKNREGQNIRATIPFTLNFVDS